MDKIKSNQGPDLRNILEQLLEIIKRQKEIYSIMESLITSYSSSIAPKTISKRNISIRQKSTHVAVDPRYYAIKERED